MACYCVARKKPIWREKTKPQAATVIWFVVLRFARVPWTLLWLVSTQLTYQNQIKVFKVFWLAPSKNWKIESSLCDIDFNELKKRILKAGSQKMLVDKAARRIGCTYFGYFYSRLNIRSVLCFVISWVANIFKRNHWNVIALRAFHFYQCLSTKIRRK